MYGDYGRPIKIFEMWNQIRHQLQEADVRADFPNFLYGTIRQSIWKGYNRIAPQYRRYARVETLTDFRERRLRGLNSLTGIGYVGEHGEYPGMRRTEKAPALLIPDTYGGVYSISRHAIMSDDTGDLLNRNPADMGYAASIFTSRALIALIESNPLATDGLAMFHVDHGNTGTAALSEDALADAITAMETRLDEDGYPIAIRAGTLAVKTARMEMIARRILTSQTAGTTITTAMAAGAGSNIFDKGTINPLEGIMPLDGVVRDPFWTDANDWYLFANPDDVPGFAIGFVGGREQPFVGIKNPEVRNAMGGDMDPYTFEFDSIDFKVRHDFGVAPVDWRGVYRSVVA